MRNKIIIVLAIVMFASMLLLALGACSPTPSITVANADEASTLPSIQWTAVKNAEFYQLIISTQSDFSQITLKKSPIYQNCYQVEQALKNDTTYYVKVEAYGSGVYKEMVTQFTTAPFNKYEPNDWNVDTTIFDFNYQSQQELEQAWTVHGGGDDVEMTLVDSPLENGGKALKYTFNSEDGIQSGDVTVPPKGWTQIYERVDDDKYVWEQRQGVKFFVQTEGDGTCMRVSIHERSGGDYFYASVNLNKEYSGYITIPFDAFLYDKNNSWGDGYLQKHAIKLVQISTDGFTKGEFIIDEFSIVTTCVDNRDVVEDTSDDPEFTPAENFEDFESYPLGEISEVEKGKWSTEGVLPTIVEGLNGQCLSLPKVATSVIFAPVQNNWSAYKGISFNAVATQGQTVAYVQIKDINQNYSQFTIAISESPKTYQIEFDEFVSLSSSNNKADISQIEFFKIYIASNYDSGEVMLDDIKFSKEGFDKQDGVLVYDDFTSYQTTQDLQEVWSMADVSLETYLGQPAMKVPAQTAVVVSNQPASLDKYNAIRVTYWTLQSYSMGVCMWISDASQNGSDYMGQVALVAASDTNYAQAVMHIPGGAGYALSNVQFKDFAADCYIAKVEFIYDNSAPELDYTTTKDSITIRTVVGCEYSIDGGQTWSDNNRFEGLQPNSTYEVAIRYKATETFEASQIAKEQVTLSTITFGAPFTNGCVLQRGQEVAVWGSASGNAQLTLTFNGQTKTTNADENGFFKFVLDAMEANAVGQNLTVSDGQTTATIVNVLVGEVWIVAGQSNIQMTLATTDFTEDDLKQSENGQIRLFKQEMAVSDTPQLQCDGKWVVADSTEAVSFSAIGYMFGANLNKQLGVPVGIIYAAQGATNIEAWISSDSYNGSDATGNTNYNAMVNPIAGFGVKGVIWYQGENNTGRAHQYADLLTTLFADWREKFNDPDLYFMVIQLPVYTSQAINWAFLREAQQEAVDADDNADLIVTIDGGDLNDIHPKQKRYIALRCVSMACYRLYGGSEFSFSYVTDVQLSNGEFCLTVDNATALTFSGQMVTGFEVGDADGEFYPAAARIEGNRIYVTSPIPDAMYVRYNFYTEGGGNVLDENGLPLAPFRSDSLNTALKTDFSENIQGDQVVGLEAYGSELSVMDSPTGKAIKITATQKGGQASLPIGGNWEGFGYIKIVFKTHRNYGVMTVALNTGSNYPYRLVNGNGDWQTAVIAIDSFQGQDMSAWDGTVQYLIFKVEGAGDWIAIDSVEVLETAESVEPMPDLEDRVLDEFDYADKQALNAVWQEYNVNSDIVDGKLQLTFSQAGGQLSCAVGQSFAGYSGIQLTFSAEAGMEFEIVTNINWTTYAFTVVTSTGGDQVVTLNFADFENGNDLQTGVVQQFIIKPRENCSVLIDQIKLIV